METVTKRVSSTHRVEVVPVRLEKHPNADKLSIVRIFGYQVCTGSADWLARPPADTDQETGTPMWLGAYIPPDSLVDVTLPEFAFLADRAKSDGKARIKAMRLRGIESFGLLVPAPAGAELGDDVAERLKVEHYEPPLEGDTGGGRYFTGGEVARAPATPAFEYDVEAFRRYHHLFVPGEPLVISEKADGANARFVFHDGKMHCGSRTEWKKEYPEYSHVTLESLLEKGVPEDRAQAILVGLANKPKKKNLWWEVLAKTPALEIFCRLHPDVVVYGEVFGNVNAIKYSFPDGNRFAAFDMMKDGKWLDAEKAYNLAREYGVPWVPLLNEVESVKEGDATTYRILPIPYDFDNVCALAEGLSLTEGARAGTIREGVVVRPFGERRDDHVGRVSFKVVSATFLERYR